MHASETPYIQPILNGELLEVVPYLHNDLAGVPPFKLEVIAVALESCF